jgi:hypothetical protein
MQRARVMERQPSDENIAFATPQTWLMIVLLPLLSKPMTKTLTCNEINR